MENLDYVARIKSARVYDVARVTSLDRARRLSDRLGAEIYLKREDTQDVHSFKIRGAYNKMCRLSADELAKEGISARVVSMPCTELFDEQSDEYKASVLPDAVRARVAVEAGTSFGWAKYVGLDGKYVTIDHFGASAPAKTLFKEFGFTVENVVAAAKSALNK